MRNVKRTRRLKPETVAREVAMAEAESGRTPGRWPTIMLDATCTAYCDTLTAAIGRATQPTLPASRASSSLHHLTPPPPPHFSSRPSSFRNVYCGRSGTLSSMASTRRALLSLLRFFSPPEESFVSGIGVSGWWAWWRWRGLLNGDGLALSAAGERSRRDSIYEK